MRRIALAATLVLASATPALAQDPARFFAKQETQALAPSGFALQPAGAAVLADLEKDSAAGRDRLAAAIAADPVLLAAVRGWRDLTTLEQVPFLRSIFALEWRLLGIQEPALAIGPDLTPGAAFFEFDVDHPGPGKIILNTRALASLDKYASLLLLIHETRHAAQFQRAFSAEATPLARGLQAAFRAQKQLRGLHWCDFMTLLHEYDAFRFANDVVGRLTGWTVDTLSMGSYASQFDEAGRQRLDLLALLDEVGPDQLLAAFNEREIAHLEALQGRSR